MAINIKELKPEDIGRWVVYSRDHGPPETGRIKSWNELYVFVVYNCAGEWDRFEEYTAAATKPEDLTFYSKDRKDPR